MTSVELQTRKTEKEFQAEVQKAAELCGWHCLHFPAMQMNPAGFPDLLCFRRGTMLLLELKGEKGRLGPKQIETHRMLKEHGITVHLFRPSQWDALEALLKKGPS